MVCRLKEAPSSCVLDILRNGIPENGLRDILSSFGSDYYADFRGTVIPFDLMDPIMNSGV